MKIFEGSISNKIFGAKFLRKSFLGGTLEGKIQRKFFGGILDGNFQYLS